MGIAAFIFARGGSKGLPRKNILDFNGKPLIAWSIEQALSVPEIDSVIVSTDSREIAQVSEEFGAKALMRPKNLANDSSPELLSWKHALEIISTKHNKLPEIFVSIPATSPLRESTDISNCLYKFGQGDCDLVLTVTASQRNPYFNMVIENSQGFVNLVVKSDTNYIRRQDAPKIYDLTTVCYVASSKFVLRAESIFAGKTKCVKIPHERSIDIDSELDFRIAKFLHSERKSRH